MTPEDRLVGVRSKIKRAKEQVADLNSAIRSFNASQPYRVETYRDPQTREQVHRLSSVERVPAAIPVMVGDVIHNLRSSLDHLAYQLVVAGGGGPPAKPREVAFPIFVSEDAYKSAGAGKIERARQEAKDAIATIQPYKGGTGHQLWMLRELNDIDKHRLLITVGASYGRYNFGALLPPGLQNATVIRG